MAKRPSASRRQRRKVLRKAITDRLKGRTKPGDPT